MLNIYEGMHRMIKQIVQDYPAKLSVTQMLVLQTVRKTDEPTMQKVAKTLVIDSTTFSRLVQSLEKKGWMKRVSSSEDKRYNILLLTDEGNRIVEELEKQIEDYYLGIFEDMNDFEKETIMRSLRVLSEKISDSL